MLRARLAFGSRRGVVLIIALGLLALFAAVGISFVIVSKYESTGARNFKLYYQESVPNQKGVDLPIDDLATFAISQLIYDTTNRSSALRGHSLLRDMYGSPKSFTYKEDGSVDSDIDGADPDAVNDGDNTYEGSYNGNGIFAPLDMPIGSNIVTDDAEINFSGNPGTVGTIENAEVAYFLSRQRPIIGFRPGAIPLPIQPVALSSGSAKLYPLFPHNFVQFDEIRDEGVVRRVETADNREPESYSESQGGPPSHFFGFDEDYDYPDYNNWFLAMERADGHIIIPSFHRPHLVRQVEQAVDIEDEYPSNVDVDIGLPDDRRTLAWRDKSAHGPGRGLILRPREIDVNASVVFDDENRGNRWRDLLDLDGSGAVGDTPQELDADTDGDGIKDAVWIDLGYPVQTVKGMSFKPLFAFKILSLDGKINLNAHGNYFPDKIGNNYTGLGELHNSNLGATTYEINPKHALLLTARDRRDSRGHLETPEWMKSEAEDELGGPLEYKALLGVLGGQQVPGRFTVDGEVPSVNDRPGDSGIDDNSATRSPAEYVADLPADGTESNERLLDLHGLGRYFEPFNAEWTLVTEQPLPNLALGGMYLNYPQRSGTTIDDRLAMFEIHPNLPFNVGNNRNRDLSFEENLTSPAGVPYFLSSQYVNQDDAIEINLYHEDQSDSHFSATNLEKLYRFGDIDSSSLSPRLTSLLEIAFGDPDSTADEDDEEGRQIATSERYARQRMRRMFTHASWDLNRFSFPPYLTTTSEPGTPANLSEDVTDSTSPPSPRPVRGEFQLTTDAAAHLPKLTQKLHTRLNLNGPDDIADPLVPYTQNTEADQRRTELAQRIYILLHRVVRPSGTYAFVRAKLLAQLAVNIVDFMDADDVMTYLSFSETLGAPVADEKHTVFGFELPRVIINEAMVVQYQHRDGDEGINKDTVWVWAELYNPWIGIGAGANGLGGAVDLRGNPVMTDEMGGESTEPYSAYQLRVIDHSPQPDPVPADWKPVKIVDFAHPVSTGEDAPTAPISTVLEEEAGGPGTAILRRGATCLVGPPGVNALNILAEPTDDPALFLSHENGAQNNFTSNELKYVRESHVTNVIYEIGIYRLRNPHQTFNELTNPYIQLDHIRVTSAQNAESSVTGGAWEDNAGSEPGSQIEPNRRYSRERIRLWTGESRDRSPLTLGGTAPDADTEKQLSAFLGAPDVNKPFADTEITMAAGFQPGSNVSQWEIHTLFEIDDTDPLRPFTRNRGIDDDYLTIPFLNGRLASPLELLSVRLYGTHNWPDYPAEPVTAATLTTLMGVKEWKLRFTDDLARDLSGSSRNHRDRLVPWFEDNRWEHPVTRKLPDNSTTKLPILPDLYRFFELVECGSRHMDAYEVEPGSEYPRQVRVPGKICLNTITDEEVFRALIDDPWAMPSQVLVDEETTPRPKTPYRLPKNYWDLDWPDPQGNNPNFPFDPRRNLVFGRLFSSSLNSPTQVFFGHGPNGFVAAGSPEALQLHTTEWISIKRILEAQWPSLTFDTAFDTGKNFPPGRHHKEQVHSELYRMFLLSRAGADGITGTGDDKPFRSFAAPRLSDTILRQRNFSQLDGPEGGLLDAATGRGEYIVNLAQGPMPEDLGNMTYVEERERNDTIPRWVPRLFDPVPNPLQFGALDANKKDASIGSSDPQDFTQTGPINLANDINPNLVDDWMLEHQRNRLLGKMANNVTTRSHVFACWMTVGFFAVEPGTENLKVPCLNEEIGVDDGTNNRHRIFFIVDRSMAKKYDGPRTEPVSLLDMAKDGLLTMPKSIAQIE